MSCRYRSDASQRIALSQGVTTRFLMGEMTALFDRFGTEIVCHLGRDGPDIEHLADRLKIGTPKRQHRARNLCYAFSVELAVTWFGLARPLSR
jgi:hypothetical protein